MPMFAVEHSHENQTQVMTHTEGHNIHAQQKQCDDCGSSHNQLAKKAPAKCHTSAQCCTGMVTLNSAAYVNPVSNQAENLSAHGLVLLIGQSSNGIFRPPRI